jgi:hypothetical protein
MGVVARGADSGAGSLAALFFQLNRIRPTGQLLIQRWCR